MHQTFYEYSPQNKRVYSTRVEPLRGSNGLIVSLILRNLIYLSDAFASFRIKCVKFWIKFHAEGRKRIRRFMNIPRKIIEVVQPLLLKICLLSTALLRKNKCSTYSKYVSALFLFAPCIQYHYFQKANGKVIAKATTSILRNLIYSSDAFSLLL